MANNYKHTKTITDSIKVKGIISCEEDETTITYENDKEEYTINVLELFEKFNDEMVFITISTKEEKDLDEN